MRTTIKKQNELLDYVKINSGLASRANASNYLYSVIGRRFKSFGYSLSHYKNNAFTITNDDITYHKINPCDLYTPLTTVTCVEMGKKVAL